ncbi:DNA sulfur modification protein DndE [Nocardia salmonicida]|uniref:DNA sulfur modification protein DndE n=1 Tax=Nocardia salmonicida TaxID=53431 RepID=UPI00369288C1
MPIENIRLSKQGRDQLITLRRRTGIEHWNTLCRWALCRSLAEPAPPPMAKIPADSNLEMSWRTFAGSHGALYWALLRHRCHTDGLPLDEETLAQQFRLHLHRGIGYLIGDRHVRNIADLVATTMEPDERDIA